MIETWFFLILSFSDGLLVTSQQIGPFPRGQSCIQMARWTRQTVEMVADADDPATVRQRTVVSDCWLGRQERR